jgi:hypothetical protein
MNADIHASRGRKLLIPILEGAKTVHALDRAANVIGNGESILEFLRNVNQITDYTAHLRT